MRIQMRLSKECRIVLEELKLEYLKNGEVKTSGEIVDEIFEHYQYDISKINWVLVQTKPEFDGILANYAHVNPTTLNLNPHTINIMNDFRDYLNQSLSMQRTVYRSFIVRMALKAFRLENEGVDISIIE